MKRVIGSGSFIIGIMLIAFLVGSAYTVVGDVVCEANEVGNTFPWYFPLSVLALTGIPFILGLSAGQEY